MKLLIWIIAIGCMVLLSWSAYPEIRKSKKSDGLHKIEKKSKTEQQKKQIEKKEKEVEYELVDSDKTEVASK